MAKYAIIGAMCSGKTTLIDSINDDRVAITPDAGRLFLGSNPGQDRASIEFNTALIRYIQELEKKHLFDKKILVCDGCVLTPIAHLMAYGKIQLAKQLLEGVGKHMVTYTGFMLTDADEVTYKNDSVRTEDELFRKKLQSAFVQLLDDLNLDYNIISGSETERTQKLRQLIFTQKS